MVTQSLNYGGIRKEALKEIHTHLIPPNCSFNHTPSLVIQELVPSQVKIWKSNLQVNCFVATSRIRNSMLIK